MKSLLLCAVTGIVALGFQAGPVYSPRDVDTRPVLTKKVFPQSPFRANPGHKNVAVEVHLVVDENGMPQQVESEDILRDDPFAVSAVEAVKKFRFKPAIKGGVPVAVALKVVIRFDSY
jgi:protein TonB